MTFSHLLYLFLLSVTTSNSYPQTPSNYIIQKPKLITANDGTYLVDSLLWTPPTDLNQQKIDATEDAISTFILRARGIQYATQERFKSPIPVPKGTHQNATFWGPDCVQAPWYEKLLVLGTDKQAEDCLFLNVWSPTTNTTTTTLLPVLFWIHGGSFVYGGSSAFNPENMYQHRRDVVVVTVNYRLGGLGWLGGAAVRRNNHLDGSSGNFGLQDTREALKWVQRNIAAFGGDKNRVTIYGESAGSSIVAVHLVAPRSNHLFSSAIMQSGPFDNFTVQTNAETSFWALSSAAGCGNKTNSSSNVAADSAADNALLCMKKLPLYGPPWPTKGWNDTGIISGIATTSIGGWFGPTVDNVELTAEPELLAKCDQINDINGGVIIGTNLNEGQLLLPLVDAVPNAPHSTVTDLFNWLKSQEPYYKHIHAIMKEYNHSIIQLGPWKTACLIYTESQYLCPTERSAKWLLHSNHVKKNNIRLYRLRYEPSTARNSNKFLDWLYWCKKLSIPCKNSTKYINGVGHGADIPLVWYSPKLNKTDVIVADQMVEYWQNFAKNNGNPNEETNDGNLINWPSYDGKNSTLMLQVDSNVGTNIESDRCNFWDQLHPL